MIRPAYLVLIVLAAGGTAIDGAPADEIRGSAVSPLSVGTSESSGDNRVFQPASFPVVEEAVEEETAQSLIWPVALQPPPDEPEPPELPQFVPEPFGEEPEIGLRSSLFGSTGGRDSVLSQSRRARLSANAEIVLGSEGTTRVTTDAGNLLGKSNSALGIGVQYRSPVTTDTRVRSARVGQLLASGSYWFPARADLDTVLSKVDSRLVDYMLVIKGPYAVRYGPGYQFIDLQLLPTPRYYDGHETHGRTNFDYKTNGEQAYGRQTFWGGSDNWGYRVSYGHRTGNDYTTGGAADGSFFQPQTIPASYNSRDFDVALGWDPTEFKHLEFNLMRLDQSDVEYAGFIHDINALETDSFELRYTDELPVHADFVEAEGWYNRTNFTGDNFRAGKNRQIPLTAFNPAQTDADAMSTGYRLIASWGSPDDSYFNVGTDLIHLTTELNEFFQSFPNTANQLVIPNSRSTDFGLFLERGFAVNDCVGVTLGARADVITTDAENDFPNLASTLGFNQLTDAFFVNSLDRDFFLWSAFVSANWQMNSNWQMTASAGHAQRPPTLTELYAFGPFIQMLPNNLFFTNSQLLGDPDLDPEQATEIDVTLQAKFPCARGGVRGFYSWVHDYISFDLVAGAFGVANQLAFVNTEAVLTGFELYAEHDVTQRLTAFALGSYISGQDLTRDRPSRVRALVFPGDPRSGVPGDQEALPNIPPLDARIGLRLHDPSDAPTWAIEATARLVNGQKAIATSLFEAPAAGYTLYDLRAYWQVTPNVLFVGGVENLGDQFYREHLDSLAGRGVFQPGVSFYFGSEVNY